MPEHTRNQQFARRAFARVSHRRGDRAPSHVKFEDYARQAKSFPALIHACGLCQAIAFAQSKRQFHLLEDVEGVITGRDPVAGNNRDAIQQELINRLAAQARSAPVTEYLHLSRRIQQAAVWLKRYAEALGGAPAESNPATAPAGQGDNA